MVCVNPPRRRSLPSDPAWRAMALATVSEGVWMTGRHTHKTRDVRPCRAVRYQVSEGTSKSAALAETGKRISEPIGGQSLVPSISQFFVPPPHVAREPGSPEVRTTPVICLTCPLCVCSRLGKPMRCLGRPPTIFRVTVHTAPFPRPALGARGVSSPRSPRLVNPGVGDPSRSPPIATDTDSASPPCGLPSPGTTRLAGLGS